MTHRSRVVLLKAVVWALCLSPLGWTAYRFFLIDGLGANPIQELAHLTGDATLELLLGVLAVTPLRKITGLNDLQKVRRLVGLFAFFYACLHMVTYVVLDQFFAWRYIFEDIAERPYILVGTLGFLLLIPLAATSTKGWIRRLGKRWVQLHRLVYLVPVLGVIHFTWVTKADEFWPLMTLAAWAFLMSFRVPRLRRWASGARRRPDGARRPRARGPEAVSRAGR